MFHPSISPCPVCHAPTAHPIESKDRTGAPLRIVLCSGCGVVRNDPIPTVPELEQFYAERYRRTYKGTRTPRLRHAARYFPSVASHIRSHWQHYRSTRSLLDIGSGSGEFVFLMRSLGKNAIGLEPSHDYADFCRHSLQLPIITGTIDRFHPDEAFDHIRLNHVVEHLPDPVASLRIIGSWLKPGGTLYVEVPDFEHYCRTKTPGRMFHYGHIFNFDRDSFTRMATQAGLHIVERVGHTAAFLTPHSAARPDPASEWPIPDKLELYLQHRQGILRGSFCPSRIARKACKSFREHLRILLHPNHLGIARHSARSLQSLLPPHP